MWRKKLICIRLNILIKTLYSLVLPFTFEGDLHKSKGKHDPEAFSFAKQVRWVSSGGATWRQTLPHQQVVAGWWAGVVQVEDNWWAARWFATPRETGSPLAVTSPHTHLDNWKRRCRGTKIGEGVDHPNCCYGICRWNNAQGRIRNRGKVAPAQTMPASY